jgi:hypothetical protein
MKFPVTRSELLEYDTLKANNERILKELHKRHDAIITNLCSEFERHFPVTRSEKRYVFRNISMAMQVPSLGIDGDYPSSDDALKIFINRVQLMFIDCKIEVDQLKIRSTC